MPALLYRGPCQINEAATSFTFSYPCTFVLLPPVDMLMISVSLFSLDSTLRLVFLGQNGFHNHQ